MNKAWIESQQLRMILIQLEMGKFYYHERIEQ